MRVFQANLVLVMLILSACGGSEEGENIPSVRSEEPEIYIYTVPESKNDGWYVDSLASVNINSGPIEDMSNAIMHGEYSEYGDMDSILIAKNGKLVYEYYFLPKKAEVLREVRSVSKSVISMLIGIAHDNGMIHSLDEKVLTALPGDAPSGAYDPRKDDITLEHLLTMSSGLACDDTDPNSPGNESRMFESSDWVSFFLSLPMSENPGESYSYCAGSVVTATAVLDRYYPALSTEFAKIFLFDPLQISEYEWTLAPNALLHPNGLSIKPRDMLKLGKVMLDGTWNNNRVLSNEWIVKATAEQIIDSEGDASGYLWYRSELMIDGKPTLTYFAHGLGGQIILVIPDYQTIMVFTGEFIPGTDILYYKEILDKYIDPALAG